MTASNRHPIQRLNLHLPHLQYGAGHNKLLPLVLHNRRGRFFTSTRQILLRNRVRSPSPATERRHTRTILDRPQERLRENLVHAQRYGLQNPHPAKAGSRLRSSARMATAQRSRRQDVLLQRQHRCKFMDETRAGFASSFASGLEGDQDAGRSPFLRA